MGVCCYLSLSLRLILGRRRGGGLEVRETGTALLCRNTTCLSTYFLSLFFLSVGESMDEPNPSPKRHPTSGISFFSLDIEAWKAVWWWAACSATLMGAGSTSRPPSRTVEVGREVLVSRWRGSGVVRMEGRGATGRSRLNHIRVWLNPVLASP
jgi:hypothetical protein